MAESFQFFDNIEPSSGGIVLLIDNANSIKTPIRVLNAIHVGNDLEGWMVTVVAESGGLFRPRMNFASARQAEAFAERVVQSSNNSYRAG